MLIRNVRRWVAARRPFLLSLSEPYTPDTPHTAALFRAAGKPFHAVFWLRLSQSVCCVASVGGKPMARCPFGDSGLFFSCWRSLNLNYWRVLRRLNCDFLSYSVILKLGSTSVPR